MFGNRISKKAVGIFRVAFFLAAIIPAAHGQNRTVGDNYGTDHRAFEFAPFKWRYWIYEEPYRDHISEPWSGPIESGQRYEFTVYAKPWHPPDPGPGGCTLEQFYYIISDIDDDLGALMITTHGNVNILSIEDYDSTDPGKEARDAAYDTYIQEWEFKANEIFKGSASGRWIIGIYGKFIQEYAYMPDALVFVGSCHGSSFTDDFYIYGGARAAVGIVDTMGWDHIESIVDTFFTRLDGKEGQQNRTVSAAAVATPATLLLYGAGNTTLTPAVNDVNASTPLKVGDIITLQFDTECDTLYTPTVDCDWCDVGNVRWINSTTLQAEYLWPPMDGLDECEFTLFWNNVWSAWNYACLDGNTDPWGGGNAEGPSHDDYVWTMAVASCDCDVWGDVNGDSQINPVDVVVVVQFVYMGNDMRVQHENCPLEAGDVNCDGSVDPVDVVLYVDYTYHGRDRFCDDPCYWLEYAAE